MTNHEHYICKKEVAKLLMRDRGISYDDAFALVPDEAITTRNPQEVYSNLFREEIKDTPKEKSPRKARREK